MKLLVLMAPVAGRPFLIYIKVMDHALAHCWHSTMNKDMNKLILFESYHDRS